MPKIEIFRAGSHTAMNGVALDFSETDLAASAAAYDPAVHEAPLVIGHPKETAPSYGWVKGLAASGNSLAADCDQVNADFAEMVRKGSFKKISASFYPPTSPANPKPGTYYLRHVGFLGAQPPAIKGLAPVEFGEADDAVTIEFGEADARTIADLFRSLRDFMIGQYGQDSADKALPSYQVAWLAEDAARDTADAIPSFSEPTPKPKEQPVDKTTAADLDAQAAALKTQEANFAERQAAFTKEQTAFRRTANAAWLDGLVASGRPLPQAKDTLLDFMEAIDGAQPLDFGEAGKKSVVEVFKDVLKAPKPTIDFAERAAGDPTEGEAENPSDLARAALSYQESQRQAGIVISTTEAVAHVSKERNQ